MDVRPNDFLDETPENTSNNPLEEVSMNRAGNEEEVQNVADQRFESILARISQSLEAIVTDIEIVRSLVRVAEFRSKAATNVESWLQTTLRDVEKAREICNSSTLQKTEDARDL